MHDGRSITGVILAGGLSRRMGGVDKSLLLLDGKPLIGHVRNRLAAQVESIVISANGDPARHAPLGLPVIADTIPGYPGPLAGVLSAMEWSRRHAPGTTHVLSVAADTPFFPPDLCAKLATASAGRIALAASAGRTHPVFGLWPMSLEDELAAWLAAGNRKVMEFATQRGAVKVDFPIEEATSGRIDPFFNINTAADVELAVAMSTRPNSPP
jgi:molybdopterin-guanine dinucleotide biosynthesis protein A